MWTIRWVVDLWVTSVCWKWLCVTRVSLAVEVVRHLKALVLVVTRNLSQIASTATYRSGGGELRGNALAVNDTRSQV